MELTKPAARLGGTWEGAELGHVRICTDSCCCRVKSFLKEGAASMTVFPRRITEVFPQVIVLKTQRVENERGGKINKKKTCETPVCSAFQLWGACNACCPCSATWPFLLFLASLSNSQSFIKNLV